MSFVNHLLKKPNRWTELSLTLPIFLIYHLAIPFYNFRNAFDPVTKFLLNFFQHQPLYYWPFVILLGIAFVGLLMMLNKGYVFSKSRFFFIALEGLLLSIAMYFVANYTVGKIIANAQNVSHPKGYLEAIICSMGAGFYEEFAFRVIFWGLGLSCLQWLFSIGSADTKTAWVKKILLGLLWAIFVSALFSGVHYYGPNRDSFEIKSFLFRWCLGMALTGIYAFRGFASAVWTHTLYDIWVLGSILLKTQLSN